MYRDVSRYMPAKHCRTSGEDSDDATTSDEALAARKRGKQPGIVEPPKAASVDAEEVADDYGKYMYGL